MPANTWWDILNGVTSELAGILSGTPQVSLRDTPTLFEGESIPIVLVCPGPDGETPKPIFPTTFWSYPVLVVFIVVGNRLVDTALQAYLQTRQTIRDTLYRPQLAGVAVVWNIEINPKAVAEVAAALGTNYKVTGFMVHYKTAEPRT